MNLVASLNVLGQLPQNNDQVLPPSCCEGIGINCDQSNGLGVNTDIGVTLASAQIWEERRI